MFFEKERNARMKNETVVRKKDISTQSNTRHKNLRLYDRIKISVINSIACFDFHVTLLLVLIL